MSGTNIRFAQFNASLNRTSPGQLITDLSTPDNAQARNIAEIVQRTNPDVLLINEFDYVAESPLTPVELFQQNYLGVSQNGADPVTYPYVYIAPSNTGIASGFDLNNNGAVVTTPGTPGYGDDSLGFGNFPGQFGMLLLSRYPIDTENVRTFQNFLWRDMPGALLPDDPTTPALQDWYSSEELAVLPLSSKSHWDIPIQVNGETIHVLASHPTPPVFDGPEDRNGRRNHDEIRFWADYITPGEGSYIYDDQGGTGGLEPGTRFVIMGDQNADPFDGDSTQNAISQLLNNPLVNVSVTPSSTGAIEAAALQGGANANHRGDPALDTADFADGNPGNLRADYVLPSFNLEITNAGVFWPEQDDPLFEIVGNFDPALQGFASSDHRLVYTDVAVAGDLPNATRRQVSGLEFLGEVTFPTGLTFEGTEVGGLSGLTYDPTRGVYYALSDDRSEFNPARFYTLDIDLSDGSLDAGDVEILGVTTLRNENGEPFPLRSIDPEGIARSSVGTLFISSEGDASNQVDPFVSEFSLTGEFIRSLPVPDGFSPTADQSRGIRNNLAFESLTITPDNRFLYTATENALFQDGPAATLEDTSLARVIQYDLTTGQPVKQFFYETDTVAAAPDPALGFSTNGLVELLAIDNTGTLLALERSFSLGAGNTIRLYQVRTQLTTDVSGVESLIVPEDTPFDAEPGDLFGVDAIAQKELLLDFADLGLTLDNNEAIAFGPRLEDGRQTLIVTSDNNFSSTQFTQVLAFAVDLNETPSVPATLETPSEVRFGDPENPDLNQESDPDDPAIYVNASDSSRSFVITTLKNTGLKVFDLEGNPIQEIFPEGVRYNNVDLVYGFRLGDEVVDLAVASDRANDTLAIFRIDPNTRQLTEITSFNVPETIFGVDDGEQTAYGLATYTSPTTGRVYAYVTQSDGAQVAQLELFDAGDDTVGATVVRTLQLPTPTGDPADSQSEGIVIDRELGVGYVAIEGEVGILRFNAEPDGGDDFTLVASVDEPYLSPDIEGLTIYYAANGTGYLIASSQGDSTFAVFDRQTNAYLGSFAIEDYLGIDGVEESDGADIINVPLGDAFPNGLLVVQDGSNEDAVVFQDPEDGEVQNFNANFKFIDWVDVVANFNGDLVIDTTSYDPRNPTTDTLPNGVASGDVTATTAVLWTRSTTLGNVTFEYSTDPHFRHIAGTITAVVTNSSVPVKVDVADLAPGTQYYYRATDASGATEAGQFRTAHERGTYAGFRFGISGDWQQDPPYPTLISAAASNLDLFVKLGDTIYADSETPALPNVTQARTLDEFRIKHEEVVSPRFGLNATSDLYRSTAILATIDDHEVVDNFAGGAAPGESPDAPDIGSSPDPLFTDDVDFVNDTQAYEAALQAYQEYHPLRDEFYDTPDDPRTDGERRLYRANHYGSDASVFVLDTRSFRDDQLEPANLANPTEFLVQTFNPDRTLLGRAQLEQLKRDLLDAQDNGTTWKFVVVPEPIQNFGVVNAEDRFEGYAAERTELLRFIDENDIRNVVFMAGDFHGTLVNNLTYQMGPGQEQIATDAFEIVTGPVAFFEGLFGPAVTNLAAAAGLLTPEQRAFYDLLPVASDTDSIVNDKDDFLKQLLNAQIGALGYDPIGLNDNLSIAEGQINATLLQGDYVAAHTYSWTELDVDPLTQRLTVTTYGITPYSEAEANANPQAIVNRQPTIVSQFVVNPTQSGLGGNRTFTIEAGSGSTNLEDFGGLGRGSNPSTAVRRELDTIHFNGAGLDARNMLLTQVGDDLAITFDGVADTRVVLKDFDLENLDNLDNLGNIRFDGQQRVRDSFDVLNASDRPGGVFNRNRVTFLNDRDNVTRGFNSSRDVINAQGGNDRVSGLSGNDLLRGGDGNDTLLGGNGNDTLVGGEGRDRLSGEIGHNVLTGNGGADVFVLTRNGRATVTDFEEGRDRLALGSGLSLNRLAIAQSGSDTTIRLADNGSLLATLTGIQASTITAVDFTMA